MNDQNLNADAAVDPAKEVDADVSKAAETEEATSEVKPDPMST